MKLIRLSTIAAFTAAVATGTLLFVTSQSVQRAEHHLAVMQDRKIHEEDSIRVLRAEWDYLNRPDRLEALAGRYLGMKAPDLDTVTADPKQLTAPIEVNTPRKSPPPMLIRPAVYSAEPAPAASTSPNRDDQNGFQDLIHNLSEGGASQ